MPLLFCLEPGVVSDFTTWCSVKPHNISRLQDGVDLIIRKSHHMMMNDMMQNLRCNLKSHCALLLNMYQMSKKLERSQFI